VKPAAVEVRDLVVAVGGAEILCDISFVLGEGRFLSVIGPNGAGKSTLVRCLDGLVRPTGGGITIGGRALHAFSRRDLARAVSYVPQADVRTLPFTVRSFVEMGRFPHVGSWAALKPEDHEAVHGALENTDVAHLAERSMQSLSGGERQRVLIAAALAQGGRILLLDEPTTFLDYRHQMRIVELIERLHQEQGFTIVAATHDLNWTVAVSDEVLALRAGRVVHYGPAAGVYSTESLTAIYDTGFELITARGRGVPLVVPARNGS
jgi:iron complex transport system ATP-binding protein